MTDEPHLNTIVAASVNALPEAAAAVKTSALSAIVEFLGGGSAYLGAWMRRARQGVDDMTEARSIITKALATQIAEDLKADSGLVSSLTNQMAPSYVRKEKNKLRVAEEAIKCLSEEDGKGTSETNDGASVDLDWLHSFERFAEDASSENMQALWGRVLAGEISAPGRFTKSTLRFLYELDVHIAQDFEQARPHIVNSRIYQHDKEFPLALALRLEAAGIITGAGTELISSLTFSNYGHTTVSSANEAIILFGEQGKTVDIKVLPLTRVGQELSELLPNLDSDAKLRATAASLEGAPYLKGAGIGPIEILNGEKKLSFQKVEIIWQAPDFNFSEFVSNFNERTDG